MNCNHLELEEYISWPHDTPKPYRVRPLKIPRGGFGWQTVYSPRFLPKVGDILNTSLWGSVRVYDITFSYHGWALPGDEDTTRGHCEIAVRPTGWRGFYCWLLGRSING